MDIAVVGSGGWGTALSMLLHENRHEVTLISYSKEESDNLAKTLENPFLFWIRYPIDKNLDDGTVMMTIMAFCLGALAVYMHHGNIKRLREGTENKFSLHKKK